MTFMLNPFLRRALAADAAVSGGAALLMIAGASILSPLLGLSAELLIWAGVALVPFVAFLAAIAWRGEASRMAIIDIIAVNALWVAASVGLLLVGPVEPTALGYAFVLAQAATVALLAELQYLGLRGEAARP